MSIQEVHEEIPLNVQRWMQRREEELHARMCTHIRRTIHQKKPGERLTSADLLDALARAYEDVCRDRTAAPVPDEEKMRRALADFEAGHWKSPDQILRERGAR